MRTGSTTGVLRRGAEPAHTVRGNGNGMLTSTAVRAAAFSTTAAMASEADAGAATSVCPAAADVAAAEAGIAEADAAEAATTVIAEVPAGGHGSPPTARGSPRRSTTPSRASPSGGDTPDRGIDSAFRPTSGVSTPDMAGKAAEVTASVATIEVRSGSTDVAAAWLPV